MKSDITVECTHEGNLNFSIFVVVCAITLQHLIESLKQKGPPVDNWPIVNNLIKYMYHPVVIRLYIVGMHL